MTSSIVNTCNSVAYKSQQARGGPEIGLLQLLNDLVSSIFTIVARVTRNAGSY
jgi:hypothetical protein